MNTEHVVNRAIALARLWATSGGSGRQDRAARQLAKLVADPAGLDFATSFVDEVARPEDPLAAARSLRDLPLSEATFLGPVDKALLATGRALAPYLPRVVVPAARARLRAMVGHLVVDADADSLTRHIASTLASGYRLNLNLLGEIVLGEGEARARTKQITDLLARPDVDYVSVKVSSLVSQINPWDLEGEAQRVCERLRGVLTAAMATTPHKFVNLDMEEYHDLALTVEVFERLLCEPEFMHLSAGIVLQAYLPDAHEALTRLIDFATRRVQAGGAPIKVRLVKGANLAMERVDAEVNGWPQAPYPSKLDVDANYLRLIDTALRPEVAYALRLGVASHNLFHIAYAHLLADDRGLQAALDIEMLHGMAPGEVEAIQAGVANPIVLYTPVVARENFDLAISYLVRRLEEAAAPGNFLHDRFRGDLQAQEEAFLAATDHDAPRTPRRSHTRAPIGEEFTNTANSDPALARTRAAMRAALEADLPTLTIPTLDGAEEVDHVVEAAAAAAARWAQEPAASRAAVLRTIAQELEDRREQLITVMAHEAGKTLGEADPEISEAIDFACYYAQEATRLEALAQEEGLTFTPDTVVAVTPPWNFPVAIPLGGVLAALGAGAAAILKPAPQTPLCAQVGMDAVHAALAAHGAPESLAQIVQTDEAETGRALVAHPRVDTVLLTGAFATAQLFTSWRVGRERGPRVFGETSGKNALIITPSADYDLAVRDAVHSAFGHAGQKCSAASLLILVGSAARSERLRRQLLDAVKSLNVDRPTNLSARVGPLIAPADGKLRRALTELGEGEQWLVEPQQLDDAGRLWRPGVKTGVRPGSEYHRTEYFGPVMGIMAADTLEQAIEWQNATDFGLTGGIHTLSEAEIEEWLEGAEVGNAYINRHITGAIVRRQPFGGWKNSSVGPGAKAGGPNYLGQLGRWEQSGSPGLLGEIGPRVGQYLDATAGWLEAHDRDWLRTAARSDAHAREAYRTPVDWTGLRSETNAFRYRPGPRVTIRAGEDTPLVHVLRVHAAALAAGVEVGVSVTPAQIAALPPDVRAPWENAAAPLAAGQDEPAAGSEQDAPAAVPGVLSGWRVETLDEFTTRASTWVEPGRIRCLDPAEAPAISEAVSTSVAVLPGPALASGRRELLTFLREQAVSWTRHRFGHVSEPKAGRE